MKLHRDEQFSDRAARYYAEDFGHLRGLLTKTITFVVTEGCNLACTYCYECHKDPDKVMTWDVAKQAVDTLLTREDSLNGYVSAQKTPVAILEFIGGEPLLQIELIDRICDYFRYRAHQLNHPWRLRHMLNLSTNGVLYHTPAVQRFVAKNRGRLSLAITIDGGKELHDRCRVFPDGGGSFDTVAANVRLARQQVGLDSTKVTIAPENLRGLAENIAYLVDEAGLSRIHANVVFENVWRDEHPPVFYRELTRLGAWLLENRRYRRALCSLFSESVGHPLPPEDDRNWCGGDGNMLAIGTDGKFYPCIRYMNYSLANPDRAEIAIGDVQRGIDKREDNPMLACLCGITRSSQSTAECMACPVNSGCAWCSAYNYDVYGTPNRRATFICKMHKARVLANFEYWNRVYKLEGADKRFPLGLSPEDVAFIKGGG
jgi:uncharacterized protein